MNIFKQYPNMSEYYETSDGQKFFKEDPAKVHARSLKDSKVKIVSRSEQTEDTEDTKTETVKDILARLVEMDLETVQRYLDSENEKETPRKTVTDALEKRITELQNPAQ